MGRIPCFGTIGGVVMSPSGFDLELNKSITVKDMFSLGWGATGEGWQWRRVLWVWEEELLEECRLLLTNVSL